LRLGFTAHVRVKDARVEFAARSDSGRAGRFRIPDAHQKTSFRQTVDAIEAAIVGPAHIEIRAVGEVVLRSVVPVQLDESDCLFNHRTVLRIGDPPGDHATAFDFQVDIFDLLSLGHINRLPATKADRAISRRDVSWRERGDRIHSGGHTGEIVPPAIIDLGARRIGRDGIILCLQYDHYAARRLAFQRYAPGDGGSPGFRPGDLSLNRMQSDRQKENAEYETEF